MLQIRTDSIAQKLTSQAYNWIVGIGPKILLAIVIFIVGQWLIKILNRGLKKILSNKRFDPTLRPFIQNLLKIVWQVLLILGIMQVLGIQMTLFAAVIGAFGVAIGLALSGTLQNFAGGVLIILLKPFRVGENIQTEGEQGTVTSIRLFYTVILAFNNTTVIVPNSKLSNEVIFNLTREKTRRLDVQIKFKNDIDFKKVKKIINTTVNSFEHCLKDPAPRIGVESFDWEEYTALINIWIYSHGYQDIKLKFTEQLMQDLKPLIGNKKVEE